MLSLLVDPTLEYPEADEHFSPDESYPEYPYSHLATKKNAVYRAVRQCFAQVGLDQEHFNTPLWNPLGEFISTGDHVFVLCNFAHEHRADELLENFYARCTHGSVIRALIDYVLIAVGENGSVNFGNAPTQRCHWDKVLNDTHAQTVIEFYQAQGIPVQARDLRLFVIDESRYGAIRSVERRDEAGGVHVDLAESSLLVDLDEIKNHRYRVMNYNPERMKAFHSGGSHKYVTSRHILEADVVLSLPKLKTHEKVGITCALKGFVGSAAHKDVLPHHRYGLPKMNGDEYPSDKTGLLRFASAFHDRIQRTAPDTRWGSFLRVCYKILRGLACRISPVIEGAWWGNDTAWRMVLDLVRIATYANVQGIMEAFPCRKHLVLIDGIFAGEGQGPAFPTAVKSGTLLFGDNLVAADYICAHLMGFDPGRIPLLREAVELTTYPLLHRSMEEEDVIYNGIKSSVQEIARNEHHHFKPPYGWWNKM